MKHTAMAGTSAHKYVISQDTLHYILLGLVLILGAALRIYQLGAESYWVDEGAMLALLGKGQQGILTDFLENGRPPVYVWLAYGWVQLFGTSELATRMLSAVFGVAALPLLYLVGTKLFERRIGLLAVLIMSIAELQIAHAQSFRYYSLMICLTVGSFLYYQQALKSGRFVDLVTWVILSLLLFYTHYFGVFVFVAQSLHALVEGRRPGRHWVVWLASQALLYSAPAIQLIRPLIQRTVIEGGAPPGPSWVPMPTSLDIMWTLRHYMLPASYKNTLAIAVALLVLGLAAVWLVRGRAALMRSLRAVAADTQDLLACRSASILVLFWLLCPLLLPFILSFVIRPMYLTRYTMSAAPAFYLLIACGLWSIRRVVPIGLSIAVLSLLIVPGLQRYYAQPFNEQWREMAAYVTAAGQPGDVVVLAPDEDEETWYLYYRAGLPQCAEKDYVRSVDAVHSALAQCAGQYGRVWLIWRDSAFSPGARAAFEQSIDTSQGRELRLLEEHSYTGLYLYLLTTDDY